jgi:AcrR family transcriptional regulator
MPRETLTREQIVRVAIEILDAEGIDGLNMRRLGSRLGAAATAVYWHVKSKDDLVVLAGDEVFREIELPDVDEVGWRAAATAMAHDLYAVATRHPWLLSAMSTHLVYGPSKARVDDHMLGVYEASGLPQADADNAAIAVTTFVLGTALTEAADVAKGARLRRNGAADETVEERVAYVFEIAKQFPRLRARLHAFDVSDVVAPRKRGIEYGLQALLDGLEAKLRAAPKRAKRSLARR